LLQNLIHLQYNVLSVCLFAIAIAHAMQYMQCKSAMQCLCCMGELAFLVFSGKLQRPVQQQCSAVQCSAVQCSAVQCSAVQCSAVTRGVDSKGVADNWQTCFKIQSLTLTLSAGLLAEELLTSMLCYHYSTNLAVLFKMSSSRAVEISLLHAML
jgi:hypothetical protein